MTIFQAQPSKFSKGMRIILLAASILVLAAGLDLTLLTEQTATSFAWTIQSSMTAAFLGAGYLASFLLEYLAYREKTWANARVAVPSVFLFTTLTLVATLLHLDKFHLNSPVVSAMVAAYLWLAIYIAVPIALLILLIYQIRLQGSTPKRKATLYIWMRLVLVSPRNNNAGYRHYIIPISSYSLHLLALGAHPTYKPRNWSLAHRNWRYSIAYDVGKRPSTQQDCIHKLRPARDTSSSIFGSLRRRGQLVHGWQLDLSALRHQHYPSGIIWMESVKKNRLGAR